MIDLHPSIATSRGLPMTERYQGVLTIIVSVVGSFLLHLLWENVQAPLFAGFGSFSQHFWMCLRVTATGDMFFMGLLYLTLAVVHRDFA